MKNKQHPKLLVNIIGLVLLSFLINSFTVVAKSGLSKPLSVSSSLIYSTFLGGSGGEGSDKDAIVSVGNDIVYVAGVTSSPDFPTTPGAYDTTYNNVLTVFVAKINTKTNQLIYSTFVGGASLSSNGPYEVDLAVDSSGAAYVMIDTAETTFPTTVGAYNRVYGGGLFDVAIAKLNPTGTGLVFSTYLGGNGDDRAQGIAVDGTGSVYISGFTNSSDFPVTPGAFQTTKTARSLSKFVTKLNANGGSLDYSTFIHGSTTEGSYTGTDIQVTTDGSVYVTGGTSSSDFPTTSGAADTSFNGGADAFVAKLNSTGSSLLYSTFVGGGSTDEGEAIYVDKYGYAYITGLTFSANFPTTAGAFQSALGGGYDAFVTKLSLDGGTLAYSTFLGGGGAPYGDYGTDIVVDSSGAAYVAGNTYAIDFPTTSNAYQSTSRGYWDNFVAKLDSTASHLEYSTYLGGSDWEFARRLDLAKDMGNVVYLIGRTLSSDFPVTAGAFDTSLQGGNDNYIVKMAMGKSTALPFLDLPIQYTNFAVAANGNLGGKNLGRVNSWFDHTSPDYTTNNNLTRWDGQVFTFSVSSPSQIGESWYDGHNGIDFQHNLKLANESVYAAAPGVVTQTVTGCVGESCGSYGNQVWIDHDNGYATLYGHLQTVSVTVGTKITNTAVQPLGIMGNTGHSDGTHLHFGLYYDANGDGHWTQSEVVDPYGWWGAGVDPWGGGGRYLWIYPLQAQQLISATGGNMTSPSGNVNLAISAGSLTSTLTLSLWDMPPVAEPSAQLRSTGQSFLLQVLEWITGGATNSHSALASSGFTQPVTVTVTYSDTAMSHLDESQSIIFHWDEGSNLWMPLPTTVDTNQNQATAQTTEIGHFDLQAPLVCTADAAEPNDDYYAAIKTPVDGTAINSLFDGIQDEDWFQFNTIAGGKYTVQTSNLMTGVDTVIQIYDMDGVTLLTSDDNDGVGLASQIEWQATMSGTYFVRVSQANGSAYGCNATYKLSIQRSQQVFLPLILR